MSPRIPAWVGEELAALDAAHARRGLRVIESPIGASVTVGGRALKNFSSNDYLGFADHPLVVEGACAAARRWGAGAGASRLITGTLGVHRELEERLAALKRAQDAVLFSTGYQANLGILQVLGSEGSVYSDALNHASLVDGCRLARAATVVYPHRDALALERLLESRDRAERKCLVTDGVFSMDGDLAPLPALAELARRHDALLAVDDAHGTGVLGEGGRGTASHFGVADGVHLHMGTLGKALGSFGAFVAGPKDLIDLLINRARSLIYTTAPPPSAAGAALAALDLLDREPERVTRLRFLSNRLRQHLRAAGFDIPDDPSPIVPVVLGSNATTLEWSQALWDQGFWVHPIRPPTVAPGSSRLRITVTAAHAPADVDDLALALAALRRRDFPS